ncbi:MAG: hypothetical protein M1817_001673 [Caeruleum heppii]|nr:MAG: hypothetical protein M1817_001673 [Caeruleum heppii]
MPIRNPFRKTPGPTNSSIASPDVAADPSPQSNGTSNGGFEDVPVTGTAGAKKPSLIASTSSLSIRSNGTGKRKEDEDGREYKLSVVNDSGVYLPPSPPEKQSFWHRTSSSARSSSTNHRSMLSENEPFSISRESFDSYRRSFDISAKSPIIQSQSSTGATPPRQSLDSRTSSSRFPRTPLPDISNGQAIKPAPKTRLDRPSIEEADPIFEDVGLNDDVPNPGGKPKKKSLFARFGDSSSSSPSADGTASASHATAGQPSTGGGGFGFHFSGRKRGQSGQGAELGKMERPGSAGAVPVTAAVGDKQQAPQEVKVDS